MAACLEFGRLQLWVRSPGSLDFVAWYLRLDLGVVRLVLELDR